MATAPPTTAAKLKEVEAALASAGDFAKEAPEQYAQMKRVLAELKKAPPGKPYPDSVKQLVTELVRWQFDVQLKNYQAQYAAVKAEADRTGDAAIAKIAAALAELCTFLGEAKKVNLPPDAAATSAFEARLAKVRKAFADASEAAAHSTMNIPLRPIRKPIVSSGGVPLKAVQPPPRAAAAGSPARAKAVAKPATTQPARLAAAPPAKGKPVKK